MLPPNSELLIPDTHFFSPGCWNLTEEYVHVSGSPCIEADFFGRSSHRLSHLLRRAAAVTTVSFHRPTATEILAKEEKFGTMATTREDSSTSQYINHEPTYHTNPKAAYVLPNDAPEHVRLETQARHLSAIMGNQIVHAPIPIDQANLRMLDVGCGTGIVTDYLGRRFKNAEVIGLDLSPVPHLRDRPANVRFLQGNIVTDSPRDWLSAGTQQGGTEITEDKNLFDLIFSRLLVCGMTEWSKYIQTEFELLKPGGFAEIHDLDWIWYDKNGKEISDAWPWWQKLKSAGAARGLDWECGSKTQQWMKDAGFVDIKVHKYYWPFGGQWESKPEWKEFGDYVAANMVSMVWHLIPKTTGASEEEVRQMREDMVKDFAPEEGKHWVFYVTVGRKPA